VPSAILEKAAKTLDFAQPVKMDALAAVGRPDVAMQALDQQSYPGFGYEISQGATSSWEERTYSSNVETHDHAMFAGVNPSLYTQLGGIQPTGPGYSTVTIDPQIPSSLQHATASIDTPRGTVATSWTRTDSRLVLDVTVPIGTTATVTVPRSGHGHDKVIATHGARLLRSDGTEAVYSVGSGHWRFMTGG
jgi:alpha-L-rhamnosidase